METPSKNLDEAQYNEILYKYAESYNLKKQKTKTEKQLVETRKLYVIYARKSTEDNKRQVQSIEDQITHCKEYAKKNELDVIDILREEKSAKKAGNRVQFSHMLEVIRQGNSYNSILTWHPDRLARNMKESGEILDLLDNDIIFDLKFPSYSFTNDAAGKMTLSILFAMAKEFSDKLSDDTKRGLERKVREGKYCGSKKRGYYINKQDYFRENKNTFNLYVNAWKQYVNGKTQKEIRESLLNKGLDITPNQLSAFFTDPFYAGLHCFGNHISQIQNIDLKFKPMISPKEFVLMQRINRSQPRGWNKTNKFRPFRQFVLCKSCKGTMTSGLSTGKAGEKYLNVTCGNSKCKEERRIKKIKPVSNTIRGKNIIDFVIEFIEKELKIDEKLYRKAKETYLNEKNTVLKSNKEEIKILKSKKTKATEETKKISKRILVEKNINVAQKFSDDCNIILKEIKNIEKQIEEYESKNKEYELQIETEFPNYKEFLNFFENIVDTIQNTDNPYLIDQLLKLVFLNITVEDKKVVGYTLCEPFETTRKLKFLSGVDDGT